MPVHGPVVSDVPGMPSRAAAVQADWDETDESTGAYIQNKPAAATQAEMEAGTESESRAMSPLNVRQSAGARIVKTTQSSYDALASYDADTLYVIPI